MLRNFNKYKLAGAKAFALNRVPAWTKWIAIGLTVLITALVLPWARWAGGDDE